MWEDAAPMQEREPPRPPARPRSEEDLVLWAQILLCLAAVGFVLAAKLLDWPAYPVLRPCLCRRHTARTIAAAGGGTRPFEIH